jgi:hypothetical protein
MCAPVWHIHILQMKHFPDRFIFINSSLKWILFLFVTLRVVVQYSQHISTKPEHKDALLRRQLQITQEHLNLEVNSVRMSVK